MHYSWFKLQWKRIINEQLEYQINLLDETYCVYVIVSVCENSLDIMGKP